MPFFIRFLYFWNRLPFAIYAPTNSFDLLLYCERDSPLSFSASISASISALNSRRRRRTIFIIMSGPQCCENPPTLSPTYGAGHIEEIGGLKSYVSGSSDSKLGVLLVSDVFGYEAPNLRKLADKVAAKGFYVVVPDFLHGDPYAPDNAERPIAVWIKDHGADKGFEEAKPVIEALKQKGVSKIGAAGCCWGAKVVVQLAQSEYIQAGVLMHPSFVTVDDIKGSKAPIAVLGAEHDNLSPPELVKQFGEILDSKPEVDSFVKIFPGVSHGWTVRYKAEDAAAVKAAEEAHQDMLGWFTKHIK